MRLLVPFATLAIALGACSASAPNAPNAQTAGRTAELSARTTGVDAQGLGTALGQASLLPRLNSLIVARDGQVVAERVFDGPGLDTPVNIKSASKSVLSALVGIGIARGELSGLASRSRPCCRPGRRPPPTLG